MKKNYKKKYNININSLISLNINGTEDFHNKSLLVIKPDHIGDYILFRNFFLEIKNSKKYKDYHLIALLNTRVRDLAESLDADVIDEFIWLDLERFTKSDWYANRKIQEVLSKEYTCVLNAILRRLNSIEYMIQQIKAEEKILFKGHEKERKAVYKAQDDKTYCKEINLGNIRLFEFERFRLGFEEFLGEKNPLLRPHFKLKDSWVKSIQISKLYCVLFIGADVEFRKLSPGMYRNIIEYIQNYYDIDVVITGGQQEKEDAKEIMFHLENNRIYNLVGETNLIDLVALIDSAFYVISNETGAAHISTLLSKHTIVFSNGNHFGKFTPYPNEYTKNYYPMYPFEYTGEQKEFEKFVNLFYDGSNLDIKSITLNQISLMIDKVSTTLNLEKNLFDLNLKKSFITDTKILFPLKNRQTMANYNFALMFSRLHGDILDLKQKYTKIIIYGNGTFGKVVTSMIGENLLAIVDSSSKEESNSPTKEIVYSPKILNSLEYNIIVVTVLGRENEILDFLRENMGIKDDKIFIFKVTEGRYLEC